LDDERYDSTWPLWPAEVKAGFSSVMLAGSPAAMPRGIEEAHCSYRCVKPTSGESRCRHENVAPSG